MSSGIAMDLRVVSDSQFPYTLHHFSGSKEHHIPLRRRALGMHMTINDYGLFKVDGSQEELVPCKDEADIYAALGMDYIEPELREDMGEIEAAIAHRLPVLVQESDLQGVLHAHTTASDALWAGLPIVTRFGDTFPGRISASLLRAGKEPRVFCPILVP